MFQMFPSSNTPDSNEWVVIRLHDKDNWKGKGLAGRVGRKLHDSVGPFLFLKGVYSMFEDCNDKWSPINVKYYTKLLNK